MTRTRRSSIPISVNVILITLLFSGQLLSLCSCRRSASTSTHPVKGFSTRQRKIHRTFQSWLIRHDTKPKSRAGGDLTGKDGKGKGSGQGSIITLSKPTRDKVAKWFRTEDDEGQVIHCMLQRDEFNHGTYVGHVSVIPV